MPLARTIGPQYSRAPLMRSAVAVGESTSGPAFSAGHYSSAEPGTARSAA